MAHAGLEGLEVWRESREFAKFNCVELVPRLPPEERFALASQIRRSAQNVPANSAEAYGRFHHADAVRCCYVARGSLEETWSHMILAKEMGYWTELDLTEMRVTYVKLLRLLNGHIAYLRRQSKG